MAQFQPILTNAPTETILQYNKLIGEKPKGNMTLKDKIESQNIWANQCRLLLVLIHHQIRGE